MDDAGLVGRRQCGTSLLGDGHRLLHAKTTPLGEASLQGLALQILHENVGSTLRGGTRVEDFDDIGMANGAGSAGLVEKPPYHLGASGQLRKQHLDGSPPLDERILRQIDLTKAAFADESDEAVVSK